MKLNLGLANDWVQQALISAYEDNCPLKPVKKGRQSLRWTVELESLRRGVRRLFNKCRLEENPHSWALYREAQRNYRKEVRKASKNAWRTFCSSINDLPRSAGLHRALSRDPKIKLVSLVATLEGHVAVVTLNGSSVRLAISRRCLQGGVLSPLLWYLVVNDLIARLSGRGIFIQGYADDKCLLVVGKFPNTVSGLMQWALSTVQICCSEVGLSVNPDKTGLVAFTRKRKLQGFFEPRFFGVKLSFLGQSNIWGLSWILG